jgi:glycosyltransferase involved in cell wall biosynthesis
MAQIVVKLADRIVATTKSYAKTSPVLSNMLERIVIIPCGVDTKRFSPDHSFQGKKTKHKSSSPRILYVGKLIHYKGVDALIKAFKTVLAKFPNCSLMIAGDGEKRYELMDLAKKLELGDRVIFAGWVPDKWLPHYYCTSDLLVLPSIESRREAFGMVLLEAMACGIPVIASDIPGPEEVVNSKEIGLLAPPGNAEKLAQAIIDLLHDNRLTEKRARVHALVKKRYDWSVIANSYENLYKDLLK